MSIDPYLTALQWLARRELSEAQIRQRLARRAHDQDSIDAAIERLKHDRALDDERVARAIARTQATVRGRGRQRVKRQIEAAGIPSSIAARAVDETFQNIDDAALLQAALDRRLRGHTSLTDRDFARLYRYLIAQGFESDRVLAALRARGRS